MWGDTGRALGPSSQVDERGALSSVRNVTWYPQRDLRGRQSRRSMSAVPRAPAPTSSARYGWESDFPTFSDAEPRVVRIPLQDFLADAGEPQVRARDEGIPKIQVETGKVVEAPRQAAPVVRDRHAGRRLQPGLGKPQGGRRPLHMVRETKGTIGYLKPRTSEADKVCCGEKHVEALGVPFELAVSADDV